MIKRNKLKAGLYEIRSDKCHVGYRLIRQYHDNGKHYWELYTIGSDLYGDYFFKFKDVDNEARTRLKQCEQYLLRSKGE